MAEPRGVCVIDPVALASCVHEAVAAGALVESEGGRLPFAHDLLRDALYEDTPPTATGSVFDSAPAPTTCFGLTSGDDDVATRLTPTVAAVVTTSCAIGSTSKTVTAATLGLATTLEDHTGLPDSAGQTSCDAGAYELQHTAVTLDQGAPTTGSTPYGTPASYQLTVGNQPQASGRLRFAATARTVPSGVAVSTSGAVTVSASTPVGTSTLSGTVSDPLDDSGPWSFALDVTGTPPTITSAPAAPFPWGRSTTFTITTTGMPTATVSESGKLPRGLSFETLGNGTATISGTTFTLGTHVVTLSATSGVTPPVTQQLTVVVGFTPVLAVFGHPTFVVGRGSTSFFGSVGFPFAKLSFTGSLPQGLSFTTRGFGTATISGTPAP